MLAAADIWPAGLSVYPLLILAVVALQRLLPLPDSYHPLTLFRYLAQQLAAKVNPDPSRSRQQLYISGSLALLVATVPFIALLYSVYQFSELPYLLDALLLYLSLNWQNSRQQALKVQRSLSAGQLSLARQQARPLLLRRTSNLSDMGLSKAVIESLALRAATALIGVLCWFLVAGGLAALCYRLLLELQQQWNCKLTAYRHFGLPCAYLVKVLTALPLLLCSATLALQHGVQSCYRQAKQRRQHFSRLSFYLLACVSVSIKRSLGGPLYYNHSKQPRSRLVQQQEPGAADITGVIKVLGFMQSYLYLLLFSCSLLQLAWLLTNYV